MSKSSEFQAPVVYEPPDTVLARLGFGDEVAKAFIYAEAAIMKVDPGLLDIPENVAEVVKAAEYTRRYGLTPGIHLHMSGPYATEVERKRPDGTTVKLWEKRYALVIGEQAYKTAARIQAQRDGDYLDWEWEPLTPDEMRAYVAEHYPKGFELTDDDRMVRCRMLSLKAAQLARAMGRPYDPPWVYAGVHFKGVKSNRGTYPKSDQGRVPNQRTALDTAIRRGIKKATMQKYGLIPLDSRTEEQRIRDVMRATESQPHDEWMHARDVEVTDYTDIDPTITDDETIVDMGSVMVTPAPDAEVEVETEAGDNPFVAPDAGVIAESSLPYADIADSLTGNEKKLADWSHQQHAAANEGPASPRQYQDLCKALSDATGGQHVIVLSVLCRRHVSAANPCSADLASRLLNFILPKVKQDGGGYADNPRYRADIVESLVKIGQAAQEQRMAVA